MDEQVLHEPMWLRDMSYAQRFTANPEELTLGVGTVCMRMLMDRLDVKNETYTPQAYLTDLTRLVFSEARTGENVSSYRKNIQSQMLEHLLRANGNSNAYIQPAVLYTLQQLQQLTKQAKQSARDAESRAHWALLYDQIGRRLTWK